MIIIIINIIYLSIVLKRTYHHIEHINIYIYTFFLMYDFDES